MRVSRLRLAVVLVLLGVLWLTALGAARAETVTVVFVGTVATVDDRTGILDGSVRAGDTFFGFYFFETTTPDSNADPTVGDYWHRTPGSLHGVYVVLGTYLFMTDLTDPEFLVEVVNRPNRDNYLLRSYRNLPAAAGVPVEHISWQLDDPTGMALSDDRLPATAPDVAAWQSIFGLTITGRIEAPPERREYFIRGHVDFAFVYP